MHRGGRLGARVDHLAGFPGPACERTFSLISRLASRYGAGYDERGMDEAALLRDAKQGDLEAFNRLVLAYQGLAYNVALRVLGDANAAEDATQEAFLSAFRNLRSFRGGSFRAWLLRIVTNACYDELRRWKRRPSASLEGLSTSGGSIDPVGEAHLATAQNRPEDEVERAELRKAIERCLEELPPDFKVLAVLIDIQGYDYREASRIVGRPVGTVKSRLARARGRLRDCLKRRRELLPAKYRLEDEAEI